MYLSIVMPDAASLADSFFSRASPTTAKSAPLPAADAFASSDQMRKPNGIDAFLQQVLGDLPFCEAAFAPSPRTLMTTEIFGSPLLRMNSMRSSCDI